VSPSPAYESTDLRGVNCVSAADCTAVGTAQNYDDFETKAVIEHWNGSNWTVSMAPVPAGHDQSSLAGVACVAGRCTGVGWSTKTNDFSLGPNTLVIRSA
jgi:hypothetical protein